MLKSLFGNEVIEKILFYILVYEKAYAKKLSSVYDIPLNGVQQQLRRLEEGSILISTLMGKVRIYEFNPRYPFIKEIKNLLKKAMDYLPREKISKYYRERTRPRRAGKPLQKYKVFVKKFRTKI